jgi:septal ring factor EnvC (AmiA/AmiB activator)
LIRRGNPAGWAVALTVAIACAAAPLGTRPAEPNKKANAARKAAPPAPAPTSAEQQRLQRDRRELQADLAKLKKQLAASESSHSEATDALASSEVAISTANRRLRELAAARARVEQQLTALAARQNTLAGRQSAEQRQLAAWLRQQQQLSLRDPFELLLEGDDPNRLGRDLQYLGYLSRDTEATLANLEARRTELAELQSQTEEKRQELIEITADEVKNRQILEQERTRRKRLQTQLTRQISEQRQSIAQLERNDQRLAALIDRIERILQEQARKDAERKRKQAEREAAERQAQPKAPSRPLPATRDQPTETASKSPSSPSNFGQRKGTLVLPAQGVVTGRFGAPRRDESGSSGPTWKGVFIRAAPGTEVRAVGEGQVVFADWLRGFGNLMVLDHGGGYLSIYGNNESLLHGPGDRVANGEAIALVGNTGGNETPGLYFELRFQGRPFDPLAWIAAR